MARLGRWVCGLLLAAVGLTFFHAGRGVVARLPWRTRTSASSSLLPNLPAFSATSAADNGDIFWFVQLTDLHLSKFAKGLERAQHLRLYCTRYLGPVLHPHAVIVTGDLTDSRHQYDDEWRQYDQLRTLCQRGPDGRPARRPWLDLKGNHDAFDVLNEADPEQNLFLTHSAQGIRHPRSYHVPLTLGRRNISWVGLDASPAPGLKPPLNFMGSVTRDEFERMQRLAREARDSDHVIFFGHYPLAFVSSAADLLSLLGRSVYLCGHLHTLFGLVPAMFARRFSGLLELELGDWKDNRRYRILALDQGSLSYADLEYWPDQPNHVSIVVTNPKSPGLVQDAGAELGLMRRLDAVRVLVFSDQHIAEVRLHLPGSHNNATFIVMNRPELPHLPSENGSSPQPLYTAPWTPRNFARGLHQLAVTVILADGSHFHCVHTFSLDGTSEAFPLLAQLVLLVDWLPLTELAFVLVCSAIILGLSFIRVLHHRRLESDHPKLRISSQTGGRLGNWLKRRLLRRLWILVSVDNLFWPLIGSVLYTAFGPWALGDVIEGHLGVIFVWGTVLLRDLSYAPPDRAFLAGVLQLVFLHTPLMWILASGAERAFLTLCANGSAADGSKRAAASEKSRPIVRFKGVWSKFLADHYGILLLLLLQMYVFESLQRTYGFVVLLSPYGFGRIVFAVIMYRRVRGLKVSAFRDVQRVWAAQE